MPSNVDAETVRGFGEEWSHYDQSNLTEHELRLIFNSYFGNFPWEFLPPEPEGIDVGCGSGRWARCVAPRVAKLHCVDASEAALNVARRNLKEYPNCEFWLRSVDELPMADHSLDFGYSLGVLHHVPDTQAGIKACVEKLKPGAPFLLYLYYAFDNRPPWFQMLWRLSDSLRRIISSLPFGGRKFLAMLIAALVYWPVARSAAVLDYLGYSVSWLPLSIYRHNSFYVMKTDALDRFGTRLEHRFTARQIQTMMEDAGLERIVFAPEAPYWCAVGFKKG